MRIKAALAGLLLAGMLVSGATQAALYDRGGGLIYDSDQNITWLSNANYGAGSSYDNGTIDRPSTTDGRMTWDNALAWAENLSFYDSVRGATYTDWRLPTTRFPDSSCSTFGGNYNCTGSEMGYLFYVHLGGTARESINTSSNGNLSLFQNIQDADYWSATPYITQFQGPWAFGFFSGIQSTDAPQFAEYAWAVRDGDVAPIPEPGTLGLAVLGLAVLGFARRRKTA